MEKSWTERVADVAERLFRANDHFDWETLARTFYKRRPTKDELLGLIKRKQAIRENLRDRHLTCQFVSAYYFDKQKWGPVAKEAGSPGSPVDDDEASLCLPAARNPAAGMRLAGTVDLIWTARMNLEDAKKQGASIVHAREVRESVLSKRLATTSRFMIDQAEHLRIFLTRREDVPKLASPKALINNNKSEISEKMPMAAKSRDDVE